jgi:hypothetical protein
MARHLKLRNLIIMTVSFKIKTRDPPCMRIAERLKALRRIVIKVAETAFILLSALKNNTQRWKLHKNISELYNIKT